MTDSGHGHVFPRLDGVVARCGGPILCSDCAKDLALLMASKKQGIGNVSEPTVIEQPQYIYGGEERSALQWGLWLLQELASANGQPDIYCQRKCLGELHFRIAEELLNEIETMMQFQSDIVQTVCLPSQAFSINDPNSVRLQQLLRDYEEHLKPKTKVQVKLPKQKQELDRPFMEAIHRAVRKSSRCNCLLSK